MDTPDSFSCVLVLLPNTHRTSAADVGQGVANSPPPSQSLPQLIPRTSVGFLPLGPHLFLRFRLAWPAPPRCIFSAQAAHGMLSDVRPAIITIISDIPLRSTPPGTALKVLARINVRRRQGRTGVPRHPQAPQPRLSAHHPVSVALVRLLPSPCMALACIIRPGQQVVTANMLADCFLNTSSKRYNCFLEAKTLHRCTAIDALSLPESGHLRCACVVWSEAKIPCALFMPSSHVYPT